MAEKSNNTNDEDEYNDILDVNQDSEEQGVWGGKDNHEPPNDQSTVDNTHNDDINETNREDIISPTTSEDTHNQPTDEKGDPNDTESETGTTEAIESGPQLDKPPENANSFWARYSWPGSEKFDPDENLIIAANPSYMIKLREYVGGSLIILVSVILLVNYLLTTEEIALYKTYPMAGINPELPNVYLLQIVVFGGFAGAYMLYHHIERRCVWYILTDQRTWVREGILSQRDRGNLEHRNITNINEINPFWQRKFKVGQIKLYTASTDTEEIHLKYVNDSGSWVNEIRSNYKQKSDSTPTENNI